MNAISPIVPKPAHVPDAAVCDFDMFVDPALLRDPHERVRELLRTAPPVFWTPRNGGHWVAMGHAEIFQASRDTESFSSAFLPPDQFAQFLAMFPPGSPRLPMAAPIGMDPPEHGRLRAPLQAAFSPKAALALKGKTEMLANRLIDAVIDQGHCDFIPDIAEPLPVQVFLELMGLPLERSAEFRDLVHAYLSPGMSDPSQILRRQRMVVDAMVDVILARRDKPQDDLISKLWQSTVDGEPVTYDMMEDYCVLLFIAGLDTVINGMGFGIRHLAGNPELQKELRASPKLVADAAEELLRRYTFTIPSRRIAKDAQLAGWTLKAGDRLMLYLPGADLDEREFQSPEVFDLKREDKVHIAFGAGPHRCLGSHLARVELQVVYTLMLQRLPEFRLDPDRPAQFHAGHIIAFDSLPIRWD